jgi:hypothetical protein
MVERILDDLTFKVLRSDAQLSKERLGETRGAASVACGSRAIEPPTLYDGNARRPLCASQRTNHR